MHRGAIIHKCTGNIRKMRWSLEFTVLPYFKNEGQRHIAFKMNFYSTTRRWQTCSDNGMLALEKKERKKEKHHYDVLKN